MQHCLRKTRARGYSLLSRHSPGFNPQHKYIYKYLCVCIHLYLYIPTLTTPYQHCPHLSMPGHAYRSHLGLVLTLYPVEGESYQLPLICTSYTRVAGLQASYLSLPLHHTDAMTTDAGYNMQLLR